MADKHYVIAEFVDVRDGRRYFPGDDIETELERDQAERLSKAGCVSTEEPDPAAVSRARIAAGQPVDPAVVARQQINGDGLFDKTVAELKEVAETEAIDLAEASKKAEIVAAIRAHRAAA